MTDMTFQNGDNACTGSGRGTSLGTFTTKQGEWVATCGACGQTVKIGIDGSAAWHRVPDTP